jgi:monoterpene epsilon-lactone hydrolase
MPSVRSRLFYRFAKYQNSRADKNASLQQQRERLESLAKYQPMPPHVDVQQTKAGNVLVEWLRPTGIGNSQALLFFHGGGYTMGSCNTNRAIASRVAIASATPALIFEYRLAPEYPFPAALEDALAAHRWLISYGIAPQKIAFVGGSAGGGLAIATALSLRGNGDPLPAAIVCISPWVDLELTGESIATRAGVDPLINREFLQSQAARYIGNHDPRSPLISPIYADLHGLPPMLIQVGDYETLLSDSVRLADQARNANVDVTLDTWEGMWHFWHLSARLIPEGKQAIDRIGAFIRKHID